ncbi:hypothetical protein L1887_23328 [Cichorium endivia]|nr:hypothetical protein L1887_23328 [Cichorium endivia]
MFESRCCSRGKVAIAAADGIGGHEKGSVGAAGDGGTSDIVTTSRVAAVGLVLHGDRTAVADGSKFVDAGVAIRWRDM